VPGVLLSAETTYGCIAEDLGLADQWDWAEPGRVDLVNDMAEAFDATLAGES